MNETDNVFNDTLRDCWSGLHGAYQNHYYHRMMAEYWDSFDFWISLISLLLILIGIGLAAWPREPDKSEAKARVALKGSVIVGILMAIGSVVLNQVSSADRFAAEHLILRDAWLFQAREFDGLRDELLRLPIGEETPEGIKSAIARLEKHQDSLVSLENDAVDTSNWDLAYLSANEKLYGPGVDTREKAEEEFLKRKGQRRLPQRDKVGILPSDQDSRTR